MDAANLCIHEECVSLSVGQASKNHTWKPEMPPRSDCGSFTKCQGQDCWCQSIKISEHSQMGGICEPRNGCKNDALESIKHVKRVYPNFVLIENFGNKPTTSASLLQNVTPHRLRKGNLQCLQPRKLRNH